MNSITSNSLSEKMRAIAGRVKTEAGYHIRAAIADAIELAAQHSDASTSEISELQRQVTQLQEQLATAPEPAPTAAPVPEVTVPAPVPAAALVQS